MDSHEVVVGKVECNGRFHARNATGPYDKTTIEALVKLNLRAWSISGARRESIGAGRQDPFVDGPQGQLDSWDDSAGYVKSE